MSAADWSGSTAEEAAVQEWISGRADELEDLPLSDLAEMAGTDASDLISLADWVTELAAEPGNGPRIIGILRQRARQYALTVAEQESDQGTSRFCWWLADWRAGHCPDGTSDLEVRHE